ncbi:hypothetical protein [Halobacterium wangiae]|uniref:hypothetical protein n=1 Tax=Halobacterium wangiae TaxID=2902623 RepID=UPI001E541467|nr:hypothetical protein [Halobacterium wangiae]
MTDTERAWLVYREYTDKGLLNVVYATPDGERVLRKQRSMNAGDPTAAVDVEVDDLEPPADDQERQRYAEEATRMRDRHDPDDRV